MQVPLDFVCEHDMPQPWVTCTECMLLPRDEQPIPIRPKPEPAPEPAKRTRSSRSSSSPSGSSRSSGSKPRTPRAKKPPKPSTRLPRAMQDDAPELFGTVDLAYEVPDDNVYFHVRGQDNEWVAISSFPKALRPHGWLYLQVDRDVVARCRVKGVGFREKRWSQEPAGQTADLGPGPTLELHAESWERLKVDLGPAGDEALPGYRYLVTDETTDAVRVASDGDLPTDT